MVHILENTYSEIQWSQAQLQSIPNEDFWKRIINNFKSKYKKFLRLKERFLLNYSSLYSDMKMDIKSEEIIPSEIQNITDSMVYITDTTDKCVRQSSKFKPSTTLQKNILEGEKKFLTQYITAFRQDLKMWMQSHLEELTGEIGELKKIQNKNPNTDHKAILELQIKRLELQIKRMSTGK